MALGTGSALAHRAVDSVLGSRHPEPAQAQARAARVVSSQLRMVQQLAEHCAEQVACGGGLRKALPWHSKPWGATRRVSVPMAISATMWSRCEVVENRGGYATQQSTTAPQHLLNPHASTLAVTLGGWACAQEAAAQVAATPNEPCANFAKTFTDCMSDSNGDLEACRCALCLEPFPCPAVCAAVAEGTLLPYLLLHRQGIRLVQPPYCMLVREGDKFLCLGRAATTSTSCRAAARAGGRPRSSSTPGSRGSGGGPELARCA